MHVQGASSMGLGVNLALVWVEERPLPVSTLPSTRVVSRARPEVTMGLGPFSAIDVVAASIISVTINNKTMYQRHSHSSSLSSPSLFHTNTHTASLTNPHSHGRTISPDVFFFFKHINYYSCEASNINKVEKINGVCDEYQFNFSLSANRMDQLAKAKIKLLSMRSFQFEM